MAFTAVLISRPLFPRYEHATSWTDMVRDAERTEGMWFVTSLTNHAATVRVKNTAVFKEGEHDRPELVLTNW